MCACVCVYIRAVKISVFTVDVALKLCRVTVCRREQFNTAAAAFALIKRDAY